VTKDPKDWGVFKTPTLREVEHTTPYMHDGSLKTPDDVVEKLNLTDSEKSELVAFLKALSGDGRQQIKAPLAFPQ
jgi:cytochrome c peroxidase